MFHRKGSDAGIREVEEAAGRGRPLPRERPTVSCRPCACCRMSSRWATSPRGPSAAEASRRLTSRREKDGPVFDEADLNALGCRVLQENSLEFALYVFEKNVQLYHDSSNAYDSLGEALLKAGRKAEAIESYQKSLALDPSNANARSKLAELEKRP